MRILVAEDDNTSRTLLLKILDSEKRHTTIAVSDGESAWSALLDQSSRKIDLALLDVVMPGIDGLSLVERMRSTPALKGMPVILCTASHDRSTVHRALQLGISHYIVKPYAKNLIVDKIRAVEKELSAADSLEPAALVCERLGIEESVRARMLLDLCEEIRRWLQHARACDPSRARDELLVGITGYRGSCLNLGAKILTRLLGDLETILQAEVMEHSTDRLEFAFNAAETELQLLSERERHARAG